VPRDYLLVLPDGWFRIGLEPGERERSARALADRQFRGLRDSAPRLKAELRDRLLRQAEAAYQAGGIELYLSVRDAAGMPIAASLLVSLVPPPPGGPVPVGQLARACTGDRRTVDVTELPAGPAVRVRQHTDPADPAGARDGGDVPGGAPGPRVTNVDVHVQVPGSGAYLLLSFSTPLEPLAAAMAELFDAISGTLRWVP